MTLPRIFAIVNHLNVFNKGEHLLLHCRNNHAPKAISLIPHGYLTGERLSCIGTHCITHTRLATFFAPLRFGPADATLYVFCIKFFNKCKSLLSFNAILWYSERKSREDTMAAAKTPKCAANTKEGKKCKNSASGKSRFCATHKKK